MMISLKDVFAFWGNIDLFCGNSLEKSATNEKTSLRIAKPLKTPLPLCFALYSDEKYLSIFFAKNFNFYYLCKLANGYHFFTTM